MATTIRPQYSIFGKSTDPRIVRDKAINYAPEPLARPTKRQLAPVRRPLAATMPLITSSRGAPAAAHSDAPPIAKNVADPTNKLDLTTRERSALASRGQQANIVQIIPPKELVRDIKAKPRELTHAEEDLLEKDLIAPKAVVGQRALDAAMTAAESGGDSTAGPYAARVKAFDALSKVRPLSIAENEELGRMRAAYLADIEDVAAEAPGLVAEKERLTRKQRELVSESAAREELTAGAAAAVKDVEDIKNRAVAEESAVRAETLAAEEYEKPLVRVKNIIDKIDDRLDRGVSNRIERQLLRQRNEALESINTRGDINDIDDVNRILEEIDQRKIELADRLDELKTTSTARIKSILAGNPEEEGLYPGRSRLLMQAVRAGKAPTVAMRDLQQYLQGIVRPEYAAAMMELEPEELEDLAEAAAREELTAGATRATSSYRTMYAKPLTSSQSTTTKKKRGARKLGRKTLDTLFGKTKYVMPQEFMPTAEQQAILDEAEPSDEYDEGDEGEEGDIKTPPRSGSISSARSVDERLIELEEKRSSNPKTVELFAAEVTPMQYAQQLVEKREAAAAVVSALQQRGLSPDDGAEQVQRDYDAGKISMENAQEAIAQIAEAGVNLGLPPPPAESSAWEESIRLEEEGEAGDIEEGPNGPMAIAERAREMDASKSGIVAPPIGDYLLDQAVEFVRRSPGGPQTWGEIQLQPARNKKTEMVHLSNDAAIKIIQTIKKNHKDFVKKYPVPKFLTRASRSDPTQSRAKRPELIAYIAKALHTLAR